MTPDPLETIAIGTSIAIVCTLCPASMSMPESRTNGLRLSVSNAPPRSM